MISRLENIKYNKKKFPMMTIVMFNCLKNLTMKILNPIDIMIDLITLLKGVV
jgi:hypothetical protein